MDEQVKPILKSTNDELAPAPNRVLRITAENKVKRDDTLSSASCCENGVCTLNWKPKRTA